MFTPVSPFSYGENSNSVNPNTLLNKHLLDKLSYKGNTCLKHLSIDKRNQIADIYDSKNQFVEVISWQPVVFVSKKHANILMICVDFT